MLSYEDLRKIAFHIRINRPMVLFARSWILVEGETEVWILTQIASILGISLACEGIRIIEYAQCGLKPLIKIATQLGINFHVLSDGDDAGKKYAEVTMSFLNKKSRNVHLTVLPQRDIEHYLYTQGYAKDFKIAAGLSGNNQLRKGFDMDKVIELAIKKKVNLVLLWCLLMQFRNEVLKVFLLFLQNCCKKSALWIVTTLCSLERTRENSYSMF